MTNIHRVYAFTRTKGAFRRLLFDERGTPYSPFMHLFMFMALFWGLGFVIAPPAVQAVVLYKLMLAQIGVAGTATWGAFQLTTLGLMTGAVMFEQADAGRFAALGGYIVWLFASVLLITQGFWFVALGFCLPQIIFWGWFFLKMAKLKNFGVEPEKEKPSRTDWTQP